MIPFPFLRCTFTLDGLGQPSKPLHCIAYDDYEGVREQNNFARYGSMAPGQWNLFGHSSYLKSFLIAVDLS